MEGECPNLSLKSTGIAGTPPQQERYFHLKQQTNRLLRSIMMKVSQWYYTGF